MIKSRFTSIVVFLAIILNRTSLRIFRLGLLLVPFMLISESYAANTPDPCIQASRDAISLARSYQRSAREVKSACTKGGDCDSAELVADDALNNLTVAHNDMKANCGFTTPPPEPPPNPTLPGDLVINELMIDPELPDIDAEWIEIFNPTSTEFDLNGISFAVGGAVQFTINQTIIIPSNGFVVIGKTGAISLNGGITPDYIDTFSLPNAGGIFEVRNGTTVVDSVNMEGVTFSIGFSFSLDPSAANATDNDNLSNWCFGTTPYGPLGTHFGTPGSLNDSCF